MPNEVRETFGEYVTEPQTTGQASIAESKSVDEVDSEKYGSGKPYRIIVKGIIAADKST